MAPLDLQPTPTITASVFLTPQHPDSGPCRESEMMHLNLTFTLDAAITRDITFNTYGSILTSNDYLWDTYLCIVDTEINKEIPSPPPPPPSYSWNTPRTLGAEQLQALSFPFSATSPTRHQILTLQPGGKITRTVIFESSCLFERYQEVLVKEKNYGVKLKHGQMAKRWIWGGVEETTGPLGWGAVPMMDTEDVARFTFEGAREDAMSFPQPCCHVGY
jgi:hypothetical protein